MLMETIDDIQRSNISRSYELKEIGGLQRAVCSGLDIVYTLLDDFLKVYISYLQVFD